MSSASVDAQLLNNGALEDPAEEDGRDDGLGSTTQSGSTVSTNSAFAPTSLGPDDLPENAFEDRLDAQEDALGQNLDLRTPAEPGEFEEYVAEVAGRDVRRFGENLLLPASRDFALPSTATIPPDYLLNIGDTVVLRLKGSIAGTVEREIDNDGNIFLPSVGSIKLAGIRYSDLRPTVVKAIGQEYRQFDVDVGIRKLRGIRVYVTGFANNPGAFTVTSLSTLANAIFQAGGPSAGGSFRSVKVYRNGREISDFDLYQILRGGDRNNDIVLQNEDVLFIPPAGRQIAVLGSVKDEAIYELRDGETLADALKLAGGPNDLGDPERLILYRTSDTNQRGPIQIAADQWGASKALGGDIIEVLSRGSLVQPIASQSVIVRIEGEVRNPGNFYVSPNTPLQDILALAGGPTERAYLFGARLERRSVRQQQRVSFQEALEQLEISLASAPLVNSYGSDTGRRAAEIAGAQDVLELLRDREPDGRVVMGLTPSSTELPGSLLVEHEDRLVVPPRPSTVGVFGAVFRPASFLIETDGLQLRDYIEMAGGLQRAADKGRAFVVRANGEVLTKKNGMLKEAALPGDVVFVPIRTQTNDIWQRIRDISTIIFQLGVTAAAVNSI